MKIIFTFLVVGFVLVNLDGQEVWTLDRALKRAEEYSLQILQARNDIDRAELDLKTIRQERIPSLSFSSGLSNNIGRTIDPTTNTFTTENNYNQSANLNAGVQLFNGGLTQKRVEDARLGNKLAALQVAESKEDVMLAVVQQFFQTMLTAENVTLAAANLKLMEEQERRVEAEVTAGAKPENELLEIQAEVALSDQRLIQAQNQNALANLQFKQMLRLPVEQDITLVLPPAEGIQPGEADLLSISNLREKALAVSPVVRSAESQVDRAELGIRIAKSRYYPSLSLGGSLSTNYSSARLQSIQTGTTVQNQTVFIDGNPIAVGFENPMFRFESVPYSQQLGDNWGLGFGLQLSVPIYSQGSVKANVQNARINLQAVKIQKEQRVQNVTENLERTITDLKSAFRSYIAAEKTLTASTKFFENVKLSYEIGASNSFELINAQNRKEEAEINFIISKYDYLAREKSLGIYLNKDY